MLRLPSLNLKRWVIVVTGGAAESMVVVVTENVPPRLRGRLATGYWKCVPVCMLVIHQNVFGDDLAANYPTGWLRKCGDGLGTNTESGFEFQTWGENRRIPGIWMGYVWFLFFLLIINKLSFFKNKEMF